MAPALEISIPTTSIAYSDQGKPFTQYHISLQLLLRKEESKKRFSDFVDLNRDLTSEAKAAPPSSLPAKNWFSRTVNNDALTESRRVGLESYLKAIISAEDGRWRSSKAWRKFMNLPDGATTIDAQGNMRSVAAKRGMNSGQWLDTHRDLKTLIQTIRQQLKQKEAATSIQQQHALSAEIKASLVRAASIIQQLESALHGMGVADGGDLGDGEVRRRKDLVIAAKKEIQGLEGVLKTSTTIQRPPPPDDVAAKNALLASSSRSKGRVLGGPLKETERTRELDNEGVLQLQKQIMQEQDEDVMSLGQTVARLKDMGIMINEELAIQNKMLDMVEEDVDRVQGKIDVGRSRIKKIK